MKEFSHCRFLITAQTMSDEDVNPGELHAQLTEFLSEARNFLYFRRYVEVYDVFDDLIHAFNEVVGRKKRPCRFCGAGSKAQNSPVPRPE